MRNEINTYIYNLSTKRKMEKYHHIYKNAIQLVNDKNIDDVLIIYNNVNDINCLAIIDELLLLKKNVFVLYFYKKNLKWQTNITKIIDISDLDSYINMKLTLKKPNNKIEATQIKNILLCIDNYNQESKCTRVKHNYIYKTINKIKFINKIGLCYDIVLTKNIKYKENHFNLDYVITEKRISS